MLRGREKFTKELIKKIAAKGYSRIPVFESGESIKILGKSVKTSSFL
jgi:CBS domain containing-hemolysin-like protein